MPIQSLLYYIRHTNSKNITLLPHPLTLFNSSMVLQQLFCILRLFVESVDDVGHDVAGQGVAVCFGAALRVDDLRDIAELIEDIESVEGEGEARLGEGLAQACVPHEVVSVGGAVGIAAARVHGEVGAELECCGQLHERSKAVVEVIEGERLEIVLAGGGMPYADVAFGTDRVLAEFIVEP